VQVLAPDAWQRWHATYTRAASSLEEREGRIAAVAEQLEQDLELLGVTAIEDKLQVRCHVGCSHQSPRQGGRTCSC
jgi:magnesium-transporting ATPase (P-type)